MREVRFRAWSTREKCWYSNFCLHKNGLFAVLWVPEEPQARWYTEKDIEKEGVVIMQYTGLKDKHGNEVYEGDIIKADWHWDELHSVIWPDDYYHLLEYGLEGDNLEVIGNIYEHPEVLK